MKKFAREAVNIVLVIAGIVSAGMGLKGFLMSNRFIAISDASGGVVKKRMVH